MITFPLSHTEAAAAWRRWTGFRFHVNQDLPASAKQNLEAHLHPYPPQTGPSWWFAPVPCESLWGPLCKWSLPPQGTLRVSHEGHVPYKSAIKWNYRIPALLYICPNSVPQQPLSYPKVTFLRFRLELKSYLEACALYTVSSLLGPWFFCFLWQSVFTKSRLSNLLREAGQEFHGRKLPFCASNTCPSPPNMGSSNGKKPPRAPSFLHPTC